MQGVGLIPMESPLGPLAPAHLEEFIVGLVLAVIVAVVVQKVVVPRFEQMYGWAPGAMIGQSGRVVWDSDDDYRRIGALLRVKQDRRRRFTRGQQDRLDALLEESETEPTAVTSALEIQNRQHDERG